MFKTEIICVHLLFIHHSFVFAREEICQFQSEFPILVFPTCHNLESIYLFSLIFLALLFIFYVLILDAFFLAGIFDPANLVFLLSSTGPRSTPIWVECSSFSSFLHKPLSNHPEDYSLKYSKIISLH